MKRYISRSSTQESYQYQTNGRSYVIYVDEDGAHVYLESRGRGRMDFESDRAAEEFLDDYRR